MDFFAFERAALRLKEVLGMQTDKDLASLLEMDVSAFNKRKTRGSFPEDKVLAFVAKHPDLDIDMDYVLTGSKHNKDEAMQRLKQQLHVVDDEQVADFLGLSASALAGSPHIPTKEVFALAAKRPDLGLDPDWIVTGTSRKIEMAGILEVKITAHEMALIDRYRLSHKDVQRGVDALLAVTARQGEIK